MTKSDWINFLSECNDYSNLVPTHLLDRTQDIYKHYPVFGRLSCVSELELLVLANLMFQDHQSPYAKVFVDEQEIVLGFQEGEYSQQAIREAAYKLEDVGLVKCFMVQQIDKLYVQSKNHRLWMNGMLTVKYDDILHGLRYETRAGKQAILN